MYMFHLEMFPPLLQLLKMVLLYPQQMEHLQRIEKSHFIILLMGRCRSLLRHPEQSEGSPDTWGDSSLEKTHQINLMLFHKSE